jgi:N-acetyltransferase
MSALVRGIQEDEKEHAAFCKRVRKGITVSRWKNERLHKEFPDANGATRADSHPSGTLDASPDSCSCSHSARIIEIRAEDPAAHVSKLREVKALLDDALGFVDEDEFLRRGLFLYIAGKQVVGCVTAEGITRAVPVTNAATSGVDQGQVAPDVGEDAASKPAVVGVSQIWVHPAFRRRRIASRLLDAVRDKFIYGMRVPAAGVAFAQPTLDGLALAAAYVSPGSVLVYGSTA